MSKTTSFVLLAYFLVISIALAQAKPAGLGYPDHTGSRCQNLNPGVRYREVYVVDNGITYQFHFYGKSLNEEFEAENSHEWCFNEVILASQTTCPQNFPNNYNLTEISMSDGTDSITADGRSKITGAYGSGGVGQHQFLCPGDSEWYKVAGFTVDFTKAKELQVSKNFASLSTQSAELNVTKSNSPTALSFPCQNIDSSYTVSELVFYWVPGPWGGDGQDYAFDAWIQQYCFWGSCVYKLEFQYTPTTVCSAGTVTA